MKQDNETQNPKPQYMPIDFDTYVGVHYQAVIERFASIDGIDVETFTFHGGMTIRQVVHDLLAAQLVQEVINGVFNQTIEMGRERAFTAFWYEFSPVLAALRAKESKTD